MTDTVEGWRVADGNEGTAVGTIVGDGASVGIDVGMGASVGNNVGNDACVGSIVGKVDKNFFGCEASPSVAVDGNSVGSIDGSFSTGSTATTSSVVGSIVGDGSCVGTNVGYA